MTKREILQQLRKREEQRKIDFISFMKNEGFTETIDKIGNFQTDMPLFYKKVADNNFFIFNIPYDKVKNASFQADFWVINANSKNDFLLNSNEYNSQHVLFGFELETNIDLYINKKNLIDNNKSNI